MRNSSLLCVATLALALASPLAVAQIYKWTDASGRVHYGDQPPPNATQVKGPTPLSPPSEAPPAPKPSTPAAAAATTAPAATQQQQQQVRRDVATARAEQCKEARESYEKSVRAQHIYTKNEQGERVYMSPQDADATRLQLKANVDSACGS